MRLSDIGVRALPPPAKGQKLYFDGALPGFACRVSQGGAKTFVLVHGRDRRFITIGRYPILTLSEARGEAKRVLAEFTLGKVRPQSLTFAQAVELFLRDKARAKRPSTVAGYKRLLARLKFKCQLSEINHHEAARRLDRFEAPSERSHILVAARTFFNWCIKRRYVSENPFNGLAKPETPTRTRVLTDAELKALWLATGKPGAFNRIVRLAILTAQRRGELAQLKASYINDSACTFPAHITKNGREHSWPLAPMAAEILRSGSTDAAYLTGEMPFNNWGWAKTQLDKLSGVGDWTLHDIRRTVATRMAEMGIAPHVIERILNHVTGTLSPLARVYNRATFMKEMREAVNMWEARLAAIIG